MYLRAPLLVVLVAALVSPSLAQGPTYSEVDPEAEGTLVNYTFVGLRTPLSAGIHHYDFTLTNADAASDNVVWFWALTDITPDTSSYVTPNAEWAAKYYDICPSGSFYGHSGWAVSMWSKTFWAGGYTDETHSIGLTGASTTATWSFATSELRDVWHVGLVDGDLSTTRHLLNTAPSVEPIPELPPVCLAALGLVPFGIAKVRRRRK